ncbi:MAG: peptidylprolyl isomerase [Tistlia sp.]|uniref:peptidylprolyl isomerase n=1 Tax=Tistlia sp. TaxID=3057121 RepID=UPI0034A40416
MPRFPWLAPALFGLALLAVPQLAAAQDGAAATGEDPVVAVVNGQELRQSDVLRSAQDLPAQMQAQVGMLFPALIERLVDLTLLTQAARDAGVAEDERVRALVAEAEADAVRRVYLEDQIEEALTEEKLQDAYQAYLAENPAAEQVKARHILLETKEEAEAVIAELEEGAEFQQLATERSTGPSGPQGGDLGWFARDQMVAPFSEAAFELETGDYTREPVETQFGWHVILAEDRREAPAPSLEEVEAELREQVARGVIDEQVKALREEASVEIMQPAAPDAAAQPGAEEPAAEEPKAE